MPGKGCDLRREKHKHEKGTTLAGDRPRQDPVKQVRWESAFFTLHSRQLFRTGRAGIYKYINGSRVDHVDLESFSEFKRSFDKMRRCSHLHAWLEEQTNGQRPAGQLNFGIAFLEEA
jgi:hypothetical protein